MAIKSPFVTTGDLCFYRGKGIVGWLVRKWTKKPYAHVAVAWVVGYGTTLVLEADVTKGVMVNHMGKPDLVVHVNKVWDDFILHQALQAVGEPYSVLDALRAAFGLRPKHRGYYCVEYALNVLKTRGLEIKDVYTPGQLADVMIKAPW